MRGRGWATAGLLASLLALTGCAAGLGPALAGAATATALPLRPAPTAPASPVPLPTGVAPTGATGSAARGAQAFQAWCNSCHPGGQEGYGPALWGRGVALTPADIRARIRSGGDARERQRFASLSNARLDEIIDYIEAQQRATGQGSGIGDHGAVPVSVVHVVHSVH